MSGSDDEKAINEYDEYGNDESDYYDEYSDYESSSKSPGVTKSTSSPEYYSESTLETSTTSSSSLSSSSSTSSSSTVRMKSGEETIGIEIESVENQEDDEATATIEDIGDEMTPPPVVTKQPRPPTFLSNGTISIIYGLSLRELIRSPALLAGIFGGLLVGIITALLLVFFILYRMRRKRLDESTYIINGTLKSTNNLPYHHHHKKITAYHR